MRRQAAGHTVEGLAKEGQRLRGRNHEGHVRDLLARHERARAFEHPLGRIGADREAHARRDAAKRVPDAAAEVERWLTRSRTPEPEAARVREMLRTAAPAARDTFGVTPTSFRLLKVVLRAER